MQRHRRGQYGCPMIRMIGCLLYAMITISGWAENNKIESYSAGLIEKAEAGDSDAQLRLGNIYEEGEGVAKSFAEAAEWYGKAVEKGNVQAKFFLARLYYNGNGVEKKIEEAKKLWQEGAQAGDMRCQYALGMFFQEQAGVIVSIAGEKKILPSPESHKNLAEAEKWYSKAAKQGFEPAIEALKSIKGKEKNKQPEAIVDEEITYWIEDGGVVVKYCTSKKKKIVIPQKVNDLKVFKIGNGAFENRNSSLEEIIIPEGIEYIESRAFLGNSQLKKLDLPESLKSIGSQAFAGCTDLQQVRLGDNLTSIGREVFKDCANIRELKIPKSLATIGEGAFYGCSSLETINLPDTLNDIPDNAFRACRSLNMINIPVNVKTIGNSSFSECLSMQRIFFPPNSKLKKIGKFAFAGSGLNEIKIPRMVEEIDEGAFGWIPNLEQVTMGNEVKKIGGRCFSECKSLKNITLSKKLEYLGEMAFNECYNLQSMYISTPIIKNKTFNFCQRMTNIVIEKTRIIEAEAFSSCTQLSEIKIPNSVELIEGYAFSNCSGLTNIVIGKGLVVIETGTFSGFTNLSSITIGSSVKVIKENAFRRGFGHEDKLIKVKFQGNRPALNNFLPCEKMLFYYPEGADGWKGYDNLFVKEMDKFIPKESPQ